MATVGRPAPNLPGVSVTQTELATFLGVTSATVRRWVEQGCPVATRGARGVAAAFNSAEVFRWLVADELRRRGVGGEQGIDNTSLSHRKQLADTESAELDRDRKMGNVVPIGWLVEILERAFTALQSKMTALPTRGAPLVAHETDIRKCQAILTRLIDECTDELVGPTAEDLRMAAISGTGCPRATPKSQEQAEV